MKAKEDLQAKEDSKTRGRCRMKRGRAILKHEDEKQEELKSEEEEEQSRGVQERTGKQNTRRW